MASESDQLISGAFRRYCLSLSAGSLTATVGSLITSIVSSVFIGIDAVTVIALAGPLLSLVITVENVFSVGTKNLMGYAAGRGDVPMIKGIFVSALVALGTLVAGITVLELAFMPHLIALLFGESDRGPLLEGMMRQYLYGCLFYTAPLFFQGQLANLLNLRGRNGVVVVATVVEVVVGIVAPIADVFLLGGSMFGMGLCLAVSHAAGLAVMLVCFIRDGMVEYLRGGRLSGSYIRETMRNGHPAGFAYIMLALGRYATNTMLLDIGSTYVAVRSIVISVLDNVSFVSLGILDASVLMMGVFYGEEDRSTCHKVFRTWLKESLVASAVTTIATIVFAGPIADIYTVDEGVRPLLILALRISALALPLTNLTYIRFFYRTAGQRPLSNFVALIDNFALRVAVMWAMCTSFGGGELLWLFDVVRKLAVLAALVIVLRIVLGHLPRTLDDWLCLPKDFGVSEKDSLRRSCTTMDDVILASVAVKEFCSSRGSGASFSARAALFVEEIGIYMMDRTSGGVRDYVMDVRVVRKDESLIIRFRDNGRSHNLIRWMETHQINQEDGLRFIGVRLVMDMASDMQYLTTMGMNNTVIRIDDVFAPPVR